jgi:hypothetical protein
MRLNDFRSRYPRAYAGICLLAVLSLLVVAAYTGVWGPGGTEFFGGPYR